MKKKQTNGGWLRETILHGRTLEELHPYERSLIDNLDRSIAAESEEIEVRVTIEFADDTKPRLNPAPKDPSVNAPPNAASAGS